MRKLFQLVKGAALVAAVFGVNSDAAIVRESNREFVLNDVAEAIRTSVRIGYGAVGDGAVDHFRQLDALNSIQWDALALHTKGATTKVASLSLRDDIPQNNLFTVTPHGEVKTKTSSSAAYQETTVFALYHLARDLFKMSSGAAFTKAMSPFTGLLTSLQYDIDSNSVYAKLGQKMADDYIEYLKDDRTNAYATEPTRNTDRSMDPYLAYRAVNPDFRAFMDPGCDRLRSVDYYQYHRQRQSLPANGDVVRAWWPAEAARYRPSVLASGTEFWAPAPPRWDSGKPALVQQLRDTYMELINEQTNFTNYKKAVGYYWNSGNDLTERQGGMLYMHTITALRESTQLDFLDVSHGLLVAGASINDALITQLANKIVYNVARPITIIPCVFGAEAPRSMFAGQYNGNQVIPLTQFRAYAADTLISALGPEYPCGHCTMGAATFQALKLVTKSNAYKGYQPIVRAGSVPVEPKVTSGPNYIANKTDVPSQDTINGPTPGYVPAEDISLTYSTFDEAAYHIVDSRIWLGYHTRLSGNAGNKLGKTVASAIYNRTLNLLPEYKR